MAEDAEVIVDDDDTNAGEYLLFPHQWMLTLVLGFGIGLTIAIGYSLGQSLDFRDALKIMSGICIWPVLLALLTALRGLISSSHRPEARMGLKLLLFVFLSQVLGLPWWFGSEMGVIMNVAWLTPLLVGCLVLPRRRYWITSLCSWQLLLAASVAAGFNHSHWYAGVSFFSGWIS